jgi:hypothetical protein
MNVLPESLWMETYLQTYLNDIYFLIITKELCIARSNATGTFLVFKRLFNKYVRKDNTMS